MPADAVRKKIGIVGGGQLGKMMILEAKRLGFYVVTLDPSKDCPSQSVSDELIVANLDDVSAYARLARKVDVITYEWELINAQALEELASMGHPVYPSIASLKIIQNKFMQNQALLENDIPVPSFARIDGVAAIKRLGDPSKFGYPMMLKTTLGGYDGKGVALVRTEADAGIAYVSLGGGKVELMAEEFVDYDMEISIIACRGIDGSKVIYPAAENIHVNSILDTTVAPARISQSTVGKAIKLADKVMEVFEGVGTFGIEMFVTKKGDVLVNEIAPRPHNSGHYTIEACFANQFENHIRAITGLPLGNVELSKPAVMINLLGESDGEARLVGAQEAYKDPNIRIHLYGKTNSKQGRKMGHFTAVDETVEGAMQRAEKARKIVKVIGV
ncbi:MAG: 5-(carboxyamino)imidazole ribonucleotide synthase [Oscillospiraceae bacterium]|nr:5-(carboxyamino)imidazole ribonucleotide synthase [Oscillospiraceae bacterium]